MTVYCIDDNLWMFTVCPLTTAMPMTTATPSSVYIPPGTTHINFSLTMEGNYTAEVGGDPTAFAKRIADNIAMSLGIDSAMIIAPMVREGKR